MELNDILDMAERERLRGTPEVERLHEVISGYGVSHLVALSGTMLEKGVPLNEFTGDFADALRFTLWASDALITAEIEEGLRDVAVAYATALFSHPKVQKYAVYEKTSK